MTNLFNIFLLKVNFDKSTIELHLLFIFSILVKFLKKLKFNNYVINKFFFFIKFQLIASAHNDSSLSLDQDANQSLINYLNFKFL